ncbi:interleukin-3 receptor subunit alpha-like [Embiotoca jacksoni]|uniref:interleukin-3 receptor subunit alpha-like n=1 Tax=Embiotoca jacksoni TaxID=100190 RepID=UPI0037041220
MKLFPVHQILWSSLLLLWVSQSETEGNDSDVCQMDIDNVLVVQNSAGLDTIVDKTDVKETFTCLLHSTNVLNCSWSFHILEKDMQLSVYISVCDDDEAVQFLNRTSVERVGSMSMILSQHEVSNVVLHFNMSLNDKWTTYTYMYEMDILEVLSPPQNISASVTRGDLNVVWDLPHTRSNFNPQCFECQLDMDDQESFKNLTGQRSYTELNADPTKTYRIRMRTRIAKKCYGFSQWSDWSHTVTVEQSVSAVNPLVIISISLGIPMILLAVLLFLRHQRLSQALFPPIPCPPPKYKYFLEKNDALNFFHSAPPTMPEEEITVVEYAEQNPGNRS